MTKDDYKSIDYRIEKISNENTIDEDLDRLVSLAEDISENMQTMNSKITKIKQNFLWMIGFAYILIVAGFLIYYLYAINISELVKSLLYASAFFIVVPFTILFSTMTNNLHKLKQDIRIERNILLELLDMIHELENASRHHLTVDPISNALFRMRLKRLHFTIR